MKSFWLRSLFTILLCWSSVLPVFAQNQSSTPAVPSESPTSTESTDPCAAFQFSVPARTQVQNQNDEVMVVLTENLNPLPGVSMSCGKVIECVRKRINTPAEGQQKPNAADARRTETYIMKTSFPQCIVSGRDGLDLLNNYASMVYNWIAGIVGSICILIIIVSGIQISIGGLSPDEVGSAKERVSRSLIGLAVLFLSAFILYSINPTFFS